MSHVLVLFKPDCVARGLVGECLARFERRGFVVDHIRRFLPSAATVELHYAEHREKPIFPDLVRMMRSGPVVAAVLRRDSEAIPTARQMLGPFASPPPGTIRGDLATSQIDNLVHVSDSPEAVDREVALWFGVRID